MLISAAIIVRDEADSLDACLTSIVDLVDEIVDVDTGSVDDSPEVARAHGAVVDAMAWTGDFSGPRNRSLHVGRVADIDRPPSRNSAPPGHLAGGARAPAA